MKAALVTMVLLGCDCDAEHCHYLRTVDAAWDSIERCQDEMEAVTLASVHADYPLVMAVCERAEPASTISVQLEPDRLQHAADAPSTGVGMNAPQSGEIGGNWWETARSAIRLDTVREMADAAYHGTARTMRRLGDRLSPR